MALIGPFSKGFAVNFKSGGDTTRDAFHKHIQEIDRIYGYLNALDADKVSASDVSGMNTKITNLTNTVNSLSNQVTTLANNAQSVQGVPEDLASLKKTVDNLEVEVENNKPTVLKYRIMEHTYAPVVKSSPRNTIVDTWTKGTDARLSYTNFEGDSKYRIFTVPNGVYKIVIDACGGGGGGYFNSDGGNASSCKGAIYNVSPGNKLYIYAGRGGKGCNKTSVSDNTCSDGEDTEVKLGSSTSTSSSASQIIYCYGGYSAENIYNGVTNKTTVVNGYDYGGTTYYQSNSRVIFPSTSAYNSVKSALVGFSSESTLIPPYGEGGAFNTSWGRSDTGTYGVVVIKYVGIY